MLQKQFNFGSTLLLLVAATFLLLLEAVHCEAPLVLHDCPKVNLGLEIDGTRVASIGLIKYPGSTGTRFEFFTTGFQRNVNICLYSANNHLVGDFYNTVWGFTDSQGHYNLRIGNTDNRVYLYYSWDVYNFSCDATDSGKILPQVILAYSGKTEAVNPIRYICKANNGFEKKKRSVVEKKLQGRANVITLDQTVA